jgi:2-keto-3-deoxy-6-phosphogluconate aldolase
LVFEVEGPLMLQSGDVIMLCSDGLWGQFTDQDLTHALLAPLPDLRLVPTGGVAPAKFAAWKAAGCVGVGIGSELRAEEAAGLAERARACVAAWA